MHIEEEKVKKKCVILLYNKTFKRKNTNDKTYINNNVRDIFMVK